MKAGCVKVGIAVLAAVVVSATAEAGDLFGALGQAINSVAQTAGQVANQVDRDLSQRGEYRQAKQEAGKAVDSIYRAVRR